MSMMRRRQALIDKRKSARGLVLRLIAVKVICAPCQYIGWPVPSQRTLDWCNAQIAEARRRRGA